MSKKKEPEVDTSLIGVAFKNKHSTRIKVVDQLLVDGGKVYVYFHGEDPEKEAGWSLEMLKRNWTPLTADFYVNQAFTVLNGIYLFSDQDAETFFERLPEVAPTAHQQIALVGVMMRRYQLDETEVFKRWVDEVADFYDNDMSIEILEAVKARQDELNG